MWPLFDLRIRHLDVLLRPVREADLPDLCAILPEDVGHDPRLALFPSQTILENERRLLRMGYWKSMGTWDPASWVLHLAVIVDDEIVGVQTVEGDNFPALRTVDSAAWLAPARRPMSASEVSSSPFSTISSAEACSSRRSLSARRSAWVRRWVSLTGLTLPNLRRL